MLDTQRLSASFMDAHITKNPSIGIPDSMTEVLSPIQIRCVEHRLKGLCHKEIAKKTERPIGVIKNSFSRIYDALNVTGENAMLALVYGKVDPEKLKKLAKLLEFPPHQTRMLSHILSGESTLEASNNMHQTYATAKNVMYRINMEFGISNAERHCRAELFYKVHELLKDIDNPILNTAGLKARMDKLKLDQISVIWNDPPPDNPPPNDSSSDYPDIYPKHLNALAYKFGLRPSEKEVLGFLLSGFNKRKTADALQAFEEDIQNEIIRIYRQFNVRTRKKLIEKAHAYLQTLPPEQRPVLGTSEEMPVQQTDHETVDNLIPYAP